MSSRTWIKREVPGNWGGRGGRFCRWSSLKIYVCWIEDFFTTQSKLWKLFIFYKRKLFTAIKVGLVQTRWAIPAAEHQRLAPEIATISILITMVMIKYTNISIYTMKLIHMMKYINTSLTARITTTPTMKRERSERKAPKEKTKAWESIEYLARVEQHTWVEENYLQNFQTSHFFALHISCVVESYLCMTTLWIFQKLEQYFINGCFKKC